MTTTRKPWYAGGPRYKVASLGLTYRKGSYRTLPIYFILDRANCHREVSFYRTDHGRGHRILSTTNRKTAEARVIELEQQHREWMASLAALPPRKGMDQSAP